MGTYINPGLQGFAEINGPDYVDKTGLIALINDSIGKDTKLSCVSRPRRFGKSYAAKMLTAYYDCSCDAHALFADKAIAGAASYRTHLNQYNVIYLDITGFISEAKAQNQPLRNVPIKIQNAVKKDLVESGFESVEGDSLNDILLRYVQKSDNRKFIFIIDEWDSMIREAKNDETAQTSYLNLLRGWFKNGTFTPKVVAAAYMTGILPIKKDGSQSAISDFREYSMLEACDFSGYFGFTEEEVRRLCEKYQLSFEKARRWYDGYSVGSIRSLYNPFSFMSAVTTRKFRSYWKRTSAAEALMAYIDMDQDGLQNDVARLIAGESIEVDTDSFQNDVETFTCKDDVLTLLIHLGYLTYEEVSASYGDDSDQEPTGLARIPNEEIRREFEKILRKATHKTLADLVRRSDKLLQDTLSKKEDAVARAIQEVHESEYAPTFYNNEQSLRYVVKMAYLSCVDQYAKLEELPFGHGIADIVFVPKGNSILPAIVVELKWNRAPEGAISQIREKHYHKALERYEGEILLVGITYQESSGEHRCKIERILTTD